MTHEHEAVQRVDLLVRRLDEVTHRSRRDALLLRRAPRQSFVSGMSSQGADEQHETEAKEGDGAINHDGEALDGDEM